MATGALRFGDGEDFADEIAAAETLTTDAAGAARVYYPNRPHLFVGGEVWDPEANEIIEGAQVTLELPSGETLSIATDDFGDFWFHRIDEGAYRLTIGAEGYESVDRLFKLEKSLNLGDFPLRKKQRELGD